VEINSHDYPRSEYHAYWDMIKEPSGKCIVNIYLYSEKLYEQVVFDDDISAKKHIVRTMRKFKKESA
jgi:hypothetical protein